MPLKPMRVCGLMSGTSLDGLDIAIVDFSYEQSTLQHALIGFTTKPYDEALRKKLHALMDPRTSVQEVSSMNMYLGELFATYVIEALEVLEIPIDTVDVISSHGQTIWHEPSVDEADVYARPNTLQIGDIAVIAERTGRTVIGDFRTRDMAVGGQGAPLVPYADKLLFQSTTGRVLVNIGGIANLTVLPPIHSTESIIAYDTGPGNMIIDACILKHSNGQVTFDENGEIARSGTVQNAWLNDLLQHSYFKAPIPKSTGRELFGEAYVKEFWYEGDAYNATSADKIATATMFTASSITAEILKYRDTHDVQEVTVSGGGAHNSTLMAMIQQLLPSDIRLITSAEAGINTDAKEAFVFALLGYLGIQKKTNSLPEATGARKETIMGKIAWGSSKA